MSPSSFEDPDLPNLVSSAMEIRDTGLEPPLEEICAQRPDLIQAVKEALEASLRIPMLRREQAAKDPLAGRVLDNRYRLDARMGSGAMGVVYRGEDLELKRPVAVKVLRSALMDLDEAEYRFGREAEALAITKHPSVVTVHDRGRTVDDDPYIVMELLEGSSLVVLLEEGRSNGLANPGAGTAWIADVLGTDHLTESNYLRCVVRWAADLASALGAAHAAGVYHRDVKPSNMFVRREGKAVLLDFGIAAQVSQETITREGTALGTPAYMAPEALDARVGAGPGLDVYGLCASLYHMLSLSPPFSGTPSQILTSVATREPVPLAKARPGLPKDLLAIVECGMARRPQDRYASAVQLENDLRAFLAHRPVKARASTALTRTLRRLGRSSAVRAASLVAVTGLLLLAWRSYSQGRAAERAERFTVLWSQLPPSLGITLYENRPFSAEEGHAHIARLLDDLVANGHDPVAALLARASFRIDHGELDGAKQDMLALRNHVGTAYADALAERYAALPDGTVGVAELSLEGLPEPSDERAVFVAGYQLARKLQRKSAAAMFADQRLSDYFPARELLLQCDPKNGTHLLEGAAALEAIAGRRTANTANLIGTAFILLKDYENALGPLRDGLELAPYSEPLTWNHGWARWRLGDVDGAKEDWLQCIAAKPHYTKPYYHLVDVLLEHQRLAECGEFLASAPLAELPGNEGTMAYLQAELLTGQAVEQMENGEEERAQELAQEAVTAYDFAASMGEDKEPARREWAEAILEGSYGDIFARALALASGDALSPYRLEFALGRMPAALSPEETEVVRAHLSVLVQSLKAAQSTAVSVKVAPKKH